MKFFIVCPLGWEKEVAEEMREVWPYLLGVDARLHQTLFPDIEIQKGGITFKAELAQAIGLLHWMKLPSRILLRVDSWKAKDFPEFVRRLKKIDWQPLLGKKKPSSHWKIQASESRLNNEKRLLACVEEVYSKPVQITDPEIYLRMHQDTVTISIDLAGEHLHKRGIATQKSDAPVRETIAAYILRKMIEDTPPGYTQNIRLIDPTCGAGTLLIEAATLYQPNFSRGFEYSKLTATPKLFKINGWEKNYQKIIKPFSLFKSYEGFDISEKQIQAAKQNAAGFAINFAVQDVLDSQKLDGRNWVICNPPYGERVTGLNIVKMFSSCCEAYHPERLGFLIPPKMVKSLEEYIGKQGSAEYQITKKIPISNGGIRTEFVVIQLNEKWAAKA